MQALMADPDPPQDDTFIVKVFFCIFIFADSVFFGILPSKWKRIRNSQTIISLLNAFSAGVFIAIAFNHILPEAAEKYNDLCPANERCFPWPFFITFLGYSMILLLDKVAFDTHSLFDGDHGHGVDPAEERLHEISRLSVIRQEEAMKTGDKKAIRKSMVQNQEELREGLKSYMNKYDSMGVRMSVATRSKKGRHTVAQGDIFNQQKYFVEDSSNDLGGRSKKLGLQGASEILTSYDRSKKLISEEHDIKEEGKHEDDDSCSECEALAKGVTPDQKQKAHMMHKKKKKRCCSCNMTPFILMIALSVHAFFEGIAVGIEPSISSVWSLIIGIAIHKSAAAVSLGISLQKSFPDNLKIPVRMSIGFAIASPFGIIIGMFLRESSPMVNVVFSSIAAGTFVYIACSEVIVEEFALPGNRFKKYVVFLLGALMITSLWFLDTD